MKHDTTLQIMAYTISDVKSKCSLRL